MRCAVAKCNNDSRQTPEGVTYHTFPTEQSLLEAWLAALQAAGCKLEEHGAVCSEHFLEEDLLMSSSGLRTLRMGAVPVIDVRVCRICFTKDCKLYSMMSYKALCKAYETLTGLLVEFEERIPPYLCSECARQLQNCVRFRNTSLKAHLMLLDIVKFHGHVTLDLIQSVKDQSSLSLNQTDCDLDIELPERDNIYTDTQADIKHSHGPCNVDFAMKVNIKVERNDDVINQDNNNPETTINEELGCIPSLPEDITDIKIEYDCEINQDHAKVDSINADMKHGHEFVDEDYSSDVKDGSEEARQKAKLGNTTMWEITKVPKNSTQAKVDMRRIPGLTKNKLCCDICPYKTNNELHWSNHLKAHDAAVSYSCNMCSYITIRKSTLISHARVHSGVKPYSCDTCNKTFNRKGHLKEHLRIHSSVRPYSCDMCDKSFNEKESLKIHMKSHFGVKPFTCNICNKSFNRKAHHKQHMRTHTGEKPFSCEICNKSFSQKSSLVVHLTTHSDEKPFSCDLCNKSFHHKGYLTIHMSTHSGVKPFSCSMCNKSFNQKTTLIVHMRTHSGVKPFSCGICNKSFNQKVALTGHMRIHTGVKPFSCDICSKSFTRKGTLMIHMSSHSGVRPYSCNICNKSYNHKYNLTLHMRTHSGIKQFTCDICNKSFIHKFVLTQHMKTHSDIKPFSCDICKKSYKRKAEHTAHLKTHSSVKPDSHDMYSI